MDYSQQPIPAMPTRLTRLADLSPDEEGDFFALLTAKAEQKTREGKPYYRVSFRDSDREVSFPIWNDSPWFEVCRDDWTPGAFFKIRAFYRETNFGPQLDIHKIRPATDEDQSDGFDRAMCLPRSRFDPQAMFDSLISLVDENVADRAVADLVREILSENRPALLTLPAAKRNHHAYLGGWLEHVLSVTRLAHFLATHYAEYYTDAEPPLDHDLVIAGAVLHDIGKLRELVEHPGGADYTASGSLIGHILQGRDILREAAAASHLEPEKLLRLEHVIVSHQRLPEWGSPKPPMTPEATIVHYADDLDAKLNMMIAALADDPTDGPLTSRHNPLRQLIYRGGD